MEVDGGKRFLMIPRDWTVHGTHIFCNIPSRREELLKRGIAKDFYLCPECAAPDVLGRNLARLLTQTVSTSEPTVVECR